MKANVNLSLGAIHQVRGQVARAIKYYNASLMIFKSTEDDRRVGHTCYHLGVSHREYGAWARSGMSYEKSLQLARKNRDMGMIGLIYLSRAETQILLSDASMAVMYTRRAMRIFVRIDDPLGQAASLRRAWDRAKDFLTESLKLQQKYKARLGEAETLEAWGRLYEQMKDPIDAMKYYERAMTMYQEIGAEKDEQGIRDLISNLYTRVMA